MGHYDDIRDAEDDRRAREHRLTQLVNVCRDLRRLCGNEPDGEVSVGEMLRLKNIADIQVRQLQNMIKRAEHLFEDMRFSGDLNITHKGT